MCEFTGTKLDRNRRFDRAIREICMSVGANTHDGNAFLSWKERIIDEGRRRQEILNKKKQQLRCLLFGRDASEREEH